MLNFNLSMIMLLLNNFVNILTLQIQESIRHLKNLFYREWLKRDLESARAGGGKGTKLMAVADSSGFPLAVYTTSA
jgi:hypothetical protein